MTVKELIAYLETIVESATVVTADHREVNVGDFEFSDDKRGPLFVLPKVREEK